MTKHNEINRDVVKEMSKESKQELNADMITGEPGSHPVGTGVGGLGGAAAGAAVGSLAGPLGTLIGGAIGAIVGGGAGSAAAEVINPTNEEAYWRAHYANSPHYVDGHDFDQDYHPAYAVGYANRHRYPENAHFEDHESELHQSWNEVKGDSRLSWDDAKHATKQAWNRLTPFNNTKEDDYWRDHHARTDYYVDSYDYERDYRPAYRAGYIANRQYPAGSRFEDHESELEQQWSQLKGESRMAWADAKHAVRDAWNRMTS